MIGSETLFKKIMEKLHLLLFNSNNCKYNCRGGFIAENEIFVSYYKFFIKGIKIVLNLRVQVTLSKKETFYIKSQEEILKNKKKHPHCDKLECKLLNRLEDALVILLLFV